MTAHVKLLLFTRHQGDPICAAIAAKTRSQYTHAALLVDAATNTIYEQFLPHCRYRVLEDSELDGIHVFSIEGWNAERDAALRTLVATREALKVPYWPEGLALFDAVIRAFHGEATDDDWHRHAFCSMEVFRDIRESGVALLNAHDFEVTPAILGMSPLLQRDSQLTSCLGNAALALVDSGAATQNAAN